ncbi:MAG: phage/plasmid primase, P4 family, partial [Actinomycetota bacterium]|nr:phage/plasmid primase, P4 family [Actinomycetota bacterium]
MLETKTADSLFPENIPEELRRRPQWVNWRLERRGDDLTKIPYSPRTGERAKSTDLATWATFEESTRGVREDGYSGVGFVFCSGDPYVGIDLDECRNPETGELESWAEKIVREMDSYTEFSPSGSGVHVIIRGQLPKGWRNRKDKVEVYDKGRFFTITGKVREDTPRTFNDRQAQLEEMFAPILGPDRSALGRRPDADHSDLTDLTDEEILRKAAAAGNGPKFQCLWAGDTSDYDSHSDADLALASMIAFWTGPDEARIERIFSESALADRDKWRKRQDYRTRTIRYALKGMTDFYTPPHRPPADTSDAGEEENRAMRSRREEGHKELKEIVYGEGGGRPAGMPFNTTDMGNAERLAARHGEDLRYVHAWGGWLVWTGRHWEADETGEVVRRAKRTARAIYGEAEKPEYAELRKELGRHAIKSEAKSRIEAMVALAQSEPGIPVRPDELDADRWLLNVENGTIDLRSGELREQRREDLIMRLAPVEYDPDAKAPTWGEFLERVLPSEELRGFVQRAVGYSLTGDTRERVLLILHGMGRNGKSTFLEAIREALGAEDGYAMKTPAETLMAKPAGGIPNDVARLKGARFVAASETEKDRRLAEALVKEITGNDTISARFMRAEWFDFRPTHKVWLATNHKPEIRGTDRAIWDRIRLVPFDVRIPDEEIDRELPEKLKAELPGILAWAVRGCLDWQENGLGEPEEVREATEAYRSEMDALASFIEDCCVVHLDATATSQALYDAYKAWCEENGERSESKRSFGVRLTELGFERARGSQSVHIRRGLGLRSDREPDPAPESDPTGGKGHSKKSLQNRAMPDVGSARSDPSDPQSGMNGLSGPAHGGNPELGSLGSLGSLADRAIGVEEAAEELRRAGSGPAKALAAYLEKPNA